MIYENEGIENKQSLMEDSIGRKILDAAVSIVAEDGYENLTIRRVAKESGCSNSAIYVRFEDKDALARAVAALHAKPFLLVMDESYVREEDVPTNLKRIMKSALERVYAMDLESAHMQMLYCGSLKHSENPFIKRVESYLRMGMNEGDVKVGNAQVMAITLVASFWGFAFLMKSNKEIDLEMAEKMLEQQNEVLLQGIVKRDNAEETIWGSLKEKGVNVDKALERMKGNKEAYKKFLKEFFEDPDFELLQESVEAGDAKEAFDYAHGLKGMAGNLGLDRVHGKISILVEILRQGSLEGAMEAFEEVMKICKEITTLL
ncbi:MAG: TetR family transcriptional regulator [Lachnospiraceae bacterium]|nr:TetR family transcriptional regulator [Lachnospiraceae bacterium]MBQ5674254.1 TetR family transcriptional regulator [Lachnospiraceae bacterium]